MHKRVLVVCSGNTCRSPMAVGLARRLWPQGTRVESAGLETVAGLRAAGNAVLALKNLGIDISNHRSRPIEDVELRAYDLVLVMDSEMADALLEKKVDISILRVLDVPDPYGGDLDVYQRTARELEGKLSSLQEARH